MNGSVANVVSTQNKIPYRRAGTLPKFPPFAQRTSVPIALSRCAGTIGMVLESLVARHLFVMLKEIWTSSLFLFLLFDALQLFSGFRSRSVRRLSGFETVGSRSLGTDWRSIPRSMDLV